MLFIAPVLYAYGLLSLSTSFLNCSACSLSSLARSSASACFWLRYSKSITESVRLRIKPLSRCHLNLFSSISKVSPSACPCISKKRYFISLSCNCCIRVAKRIFNHMEAEQRTSTAEKINNPGRIQEVTLL